MNIYEFMSDSPYLSFFLAYMIIYGTAGVINRILRHWNIRKHGYPPVHCDADGDFREKGEEEES